MRLEVVVAGVEDVVQAALKFELHLQAAEPVAVFDGLGVGAVVLLHAVHKFGIHELLLGDLGQFADVVERHADVSRQAGNEGTEVLVQVHVGEHLGVGILVLAGFLKLGHGVAVAVNRRSAVDAVSLLDGERRGRGLVEKLLDSVAAAAHVVWLVALGQAGHHADLHRR